MSAPNNFVGREEATAAKEDDAMKVLLFIVASKK
jgi:hypothetical protein